MTITTESFLAALRKQESGGNYAARNPASSASGAYQYVDSTWNHFGGYAHAYQAPASVQDARARADVDSRLRAYGGDWAKVAASHFAGPGWVQQHPDKSRWDVNPVPGSKNPTVMSYVANVLKVAGAPSGGVSTPSAGGTFSERLKRFLAASPYRITITSGTRTRAEQQRLYDAWIAGGKTGPVVAKPGTSKHEKGQAADLGYSSAAARKWAHENASVYGLGFPVTGEDWHVEALGDGKTAAGGPAATWTGGSASDPDIRPNDWIGTLDALLNPKIEDGSALGGLVPVPDIGSALQLVAARTGFAMLGLVLFAGGLLLAIGPEALGGSMIGKALGPEAQALGSAARIARGMAAEKTGAGTVEPKSHSRRATGIHGEHEDKEAAA